MKRTLILLRHAKSDRGDPSILDHERSLNERGREEAAAIGALLQKKGYVVERVLCSDAKRTVETWDLVAPFLGQEIKPSLLAALYAASSASIIQTLMQEATTESCVMILGHNPGLESCAELLCGDFINLGTAHAAIFECDIEKWSELESNKGCIQLCKILTH